MEWNGMEDFKGYKVWKISIACPATRPVVKTSNSAVATNCLDAFSNLEKVGTNQNRSVVKNFNDFKCQDVCTKANVKIIKCEKNYT